MAWGGGVRRGGGGAGERGMCGGAGQLDGLHIVGGIEAQLPAVQPPAAPTLFVLLSQLGELISWGEKERGPVDMGTKWGVPNSITSMGPVKHEDPKWILLITALG